MNPRFLPAVLIATLTVAAGLGALSGTAATRPTADDAWNLSKKFREYALEPMLPEVMAEDAADGEMVLTLGGRVFDVLVSPAPWSMDLRAARLTPEGGVEVQPAPAFGPLAFVGQVKGDASSRLVLTMTDVGVAGHLATASHDVWFEPVRFFSRDAPLGLSVVYRSVDVRLPAEAEDLHVVAPGSGVAPPDGVRLEVGHQPGPNRVMTVWLDKPFFDLYGAGLFVAKASGVWSNLQSNFMNTVGFTFSLANGVFYYCDTVACQDAWMGGATTDAGTLLSQWADQVDGNGFVTYEIAHLFTGKNLNGGVIGVAWQPGRYGLSQIRNEGGTYDGGTSDYEAGILTSHEAGHNFNGRHERATTYSHCHGTLLLGTCLGTWTTHYTIMWASFQHEPEVNRETPVEYSSDNYWWIRSCNYWDWTPGSFTPGSGAGWGYYCLN